jgi:Tfp pilus assembly protein PilF
MTSRFKKVAKGVFFCLLILFLVNTSGLALDKKISSSLSHYIIAGMYQRRGELEKAVDEYKKALKNDYENSVIHLNLATAYIKNNQLDQAINELNLAINFDPQAVEPHAILALLYSLQNKLDLATGEYEVALKNASKLQPKNIDIYKSLGIIYLQQKRFQDAENVYRLMLEFAPDDAEAHFYLGSIYYELNDKQQTEKELKKSLQLKPDYAEALNYLGYVYVEENRNLGQAEKMIKKAIEIEQDNGAYIDSLGWLYFKKGKFKKALKQLERAATLLADPVIYDHLGDVYLRLGNKEDAKLSWQNSLKLDPNQKSVQEKLERLN